MNLAAVKGEGAGLRVLERGRLDRVAATQVRLAMQFAPINPADLLSIDGAYTATIAIDAVLGAEGVGIVEEIGEAVRDIRVGDLVLPLSRGNWCRYRNVDQSDLLRLPHGIEPAQAAMLRINPLTARLLLDATGATAGDVVVQNAATSAVSTWVRLLAARRGIGIVDVVRRPDSGLPGAIVEDEDLAERVEAVAGNRPVRAVLDCVAGAATGRLAACLAPRGRVVVFGHLSGEPIGVPSQLLTGRGLSIIGFSLRPAEAELGRPALDAAFAEIVETFQQQAPNLPVRAILPLADVEAAVSLARAAGGRGRVLLDLGR